MLIQVVHSHPLEDSYNHALFRTIVETLERRHEVIATDLHREHFSPVMTEAERRSYYQGAYAEEAVSRLTEQLRRADESSLLSALVVFDACHAQGLFRPCLGAGNRICA